MQSLGDGALAILKFSKASCSLPLSAASARRTGVHLIGCHAITPSSGVEISSDATVHSFCFDLAGGRRCRSRMLFFWPERVSLDNQAKTGQGQAEVGFAVAIVKSGLSSRAASQPSSKEDAETQLGGADCWARTVARNSPAWCRTARSIGKVGKHKK